MKRFTLFISLTISVILTSCVEGKVAHFRQFSYEGFEPYYDWLQPSDSTFLNPIMSGSHPDPTVCRVGGTYYMTTASLTQYPSLPIYSSNDLVTWYHIGNAVNSFTFEGQSMAQGVHSPTIRYNKRNKTYYIIASNIGGGGTFIVKSTDPNIGWSDPIFLPKIGGSDPSIFFGSNGNAYIINSDEATHGSPRWKGHRSIRIHIYNTKTDSIVGTARILVDGGLNKAKRPTIEAPKLFRNGAKYYLMFAERYPDGACEEIMYEARNVLGPYKPCKENPVFYQKSEPDDETFSMSFTGHADMVEDADGNYWAVVAGCRPMSGDRFMAGHETFLLPATVTKSGQPVILPKFDKVPIVGHKKDLDIVAQREYVSGNIDFQYRFTQNKMPHYFTTLRKPEGPFYSISNKQLNIELLPANIDSLFAPAIVSRSIQHKYFSVETVVDFVPTGSNELAGLAAVRNERNYSVLGVTYKNGTKTIVAATIVNGVRTILAETPVASLDVITLRLISDGVKLSYELSEAGQSKELCTSSIAHLTTDNVSDYNGASVAMYATSDWDSLGQE